MAIKNNTKIENLYIPVPNFTFHHTPSSEEYVDKKFIGREKELSQLQEWIKNGDSGNYLVSGHRGMGKTSFVGKALNNIYEKSNKWDTRLYFGFCIALFFLYFLPSCVPHFIDFLIKDNVECLDSSLRLFITLSFISLVILTCVFIYFCIKNFVIQSNKSNKSNYIIAKINLGHEVLNERDILSLIATNIYEKYKEYLNDFGARGWQAKLRIITKQIVFCFLSAFCLYLLIEFCATFHLKYIIVSESEKITFLTYLYLFLGKAKFFIEGNKLFIILFNFLIYTVLFFLIKFLWEKTSGYFYVIRHNSKLKLLSDLGKLISRVNAVVSEESGPNATTSVNPIVGINVFKRKSKQYPLASVRELESELLLIIEKINRPILSYNEEKEVPKLVIVFDELDKIDPEYNYTTAKQPEQPEFEKSNATFSGGMASRNRKHNVLRLMGNMKLFISSAKAKFIFISGRELYDAYLADLSDREFAVSSIFNGVIYIDSFLGSTGSKNITSTTEMYICKQLIPYESAEKKSNGDNKKDYNFREYHQFLCKIAKEKCNIAKEKCDIDREECKNCQEIIEKIIFFLSQFSVYLSHITNGSPKKIALYFEKYIINVKEIDEIDEIDKNSIWDFYTSKGTSLSKFQYCLYFDNTAQRSISFVNYMIFPVTQAIINRSSQFNDKLLVSASFLIDHIIKHHIGGFSRDNIEHIPELMEVYRTPELRQFINTIISYMRKTQIDTIPTGLYQYKFRKSVSDEIRYFSKISEVVSAIFNFTLDESLPVKRYYSKEIEIYNQHYLQFQQSQNQSQAQFIQINPYAISLVQMYLILGELQLLDEELDESITNLQNGLQLIRNELYLTQHQQQFVERNHLHLVILLIKNVLKLGLTHENQRTYNAAYALYCELMNYLVHFRYVDENNELGLDFARKSSDNPFKKHQPVLYHKKYNSFLTEDKFHQNIMPEEYEDAQNGHIWFDFQVEGDNILPQFANPLMPQKHDIITRLAIFDDVRFIYQVILAKLFVIEKIDLTGITQLNLDIAEAEFNYVNLFTNSKDKFTLAADFYRKLGAIMFIKNDNTANTTLILRQWGVNISDLIEKYCKEHNDYASKQILLDFFDKTYLYKLPKYINSFLMLINYIERQLIKRQLIKKRRKKQRFENNNLFSPKIIKFCKFARKQRNFIDLTKKNKIKKCIQCNKQSHKLWKKQCFIPCYGCNYYSKSLDILKTVLPDKSFNSINTSRVFVFLNAVSNKQLNNLRVSELLIIANALRGFADIQLSCSDVVIIRRCPPSTFNVCFTGMLDETNEINENERYNALIENYQTSHKLEKAILYYYAAAKYYRKAGSLIDSVECMKKILQIFITFITLAKEKDPKFSYFTEAQMEIIKKYIVQKSIKHLHAANSHIHLSEIQTQKWMVEIEWGDILVLNKLSNYPDIQALFFLFFELTIANSSAIGEEMCVKFMTSIVTSPYRIENTVSQRINLLVFRALYNKKIVYDTLDIEKEFIYKKDVYKIVLQKINKLESSAIEEQLEEQLEKILDSMFCLIQVAETLYSSKLSKYSNSFMADNYRELFEWVSLFLIYRTILEDKDKVKVRAVSTYTNRAGLDKESQEAINYKNEIDKLIKEMPSLSCEFNFESEFNSKIGEDYRHFLAPNYSAEMAVHYYLKAIEANSSGQTYKDMISDMYLVDDDINNPDLTFSLALERYRINCGDIKKKKDQLKDNYKNATYFEMDNYVGV